MKKLTSAVTVSLAVFVLSGLTFAKTEIPEQTNPDACRTIRGKTECKRWYRVPGVIVLEGVRFDSGSAHIRPESRRILDENAERLIARGSPKIRIEGHTDAEGSAEANQRLSLARARAVLDYFAKKGVNRRSMIAEGKGESAPVATNDTAQGRAKNRRIEIHMR